jgi:hypothetical protein
MQVLFSVVENMTDGSKDSKAEMELKKIYKRKQLHETSP